MHLRGTRLNLDSHTVAPATAGPTSTDGPASPLLAQAAFALLAAVAAAAALADVPWPWCAAWALALVAVTALRDRLPGVLALWAANGVVWGIGAAGAHTIAAATGVAVLLAAAAPLLAAGRVPAGRYHLLALAVGACAPLAGLMLVTGTLAGIATAAMLAVVGWAAFGVQQRLHGLFAALETETAQRQAAEALTERLSDEVQVLKVETRAVGETKDTLAGELSNATQELAVLRTKAGALSTVLQRINPYDTETGLLTAEKFANVMNREWARMRRQELPLSLMLVSLDRFDDFQAKHSRLAHEAALRKISDVLRNAGNRPGDVAARLGPGAFALLFPETDHKHVNRLADAVRSRIRQLGVLADPAEAGKPLTATVGMATVIPNNDITPVVLRERVEAALYEAQFQGGDRSVRYRTMDSIRVEHWDTAQEGQLTADSVRHKLAVLGYDAAPKTYRPGETPPSRRVPVDSVEAVVEGQLKISLDGEARVLKPGDLLFIPKGLMTSVEVVGARPVLCLEAIRA